VPDRIVVDREDANAWWAHCPHHLDREASLIINKTGRFAGRWHCFSCGRDGWADELGFDCAFIPTMDLPRPSRDWQSLREGMAKSRVDACRLGHSWGVSEADVDAFGHRHDGQAHVFPMYDGQGKITGLQQRFETGRKVCYPGSKLGLFLPNPFARPRIDCLVILPDNDDAGKHSAHRMVVAAKAQLPVAVLQIPSNLKDLREFYQVKGGQNVCDCIGMRGTFNFGYVCEGLSDAVVAHHLGFYAIGLPSATSGHEKVIEWVLGGKPNGTK